MYYYFVSYFYTGFGPLSSGFDCCEIKRDKPITNIIDIQEISTEIKDRSHYVSSVSVLNYQLFRKEPDAE